MESMAADLHAYITAHGSELDPAKMGGFYEQYPVHLTTQKDAGLKWKDFAAAYDGFLWDSGHKHQKNQRLCTKPRLAAPSSDLSKPSPRPLAGKEAGPVGTDADIDTKPTLPVVTVAAPSLLPKGSLVVLDGFSSKSRSEHNGAGGTVVGHHANKYIVELDARDSPACTEDDGIPPGVVSSGGTRLPVGPANLLLRPSAEPKDVDYASLFTAGATELLVDKVPSAAVWESVSVITVAAAVTSLFGVTTNFVKSRYVISFSAIFR